MSSSARPWFSIVTPSLDRARGLEHAIHSVLAQRFASFEHIVVDGGSTDDTHEILREFPHLRVLVEADHGIYDALNKGIAMARGRWFVFLNTDDELPKGALEALARATDRPGAPDQIGGRASVADDDGRPLERRRASMDLTELAFGAPVFNARTFSARALREAGPFDTSLMLAGDRDYLLRLRLARASFGRVEHQVYAYTSHAGSLTLRSPPAAALAERIAREHASIAARLLTRASPGSEWVVLRAWLAYERSRRALHTGTSVANVDLSEAGWRLLANGFKARTALWRRAAGGP